MTAKEIIRKKHGTSGFEPMWLTLDINEIVWLMKEYHKQQLKILNIPVVTVSSPLIEGRTKSNIKNTSGKKRKAPPPPKPN